MWLGFNYFDLILVVIISSMRITASNVSEALTFDPIEARRFFDFAAASYTSHVDKCLSVIPGNFHLLWKKTTRCDWNSSCFAFISMSTSSKAIVIAFRGSTSSKMIIKHALEHLGLLKQSLLGGSVYRKFYNAYKSFQPEMLNILKCLVKDNPTFEVWVTGHSLGAAIASIVSAKLLDKKIVASAKLKTVVFGMPRVGTYEYAQNYDKLHKHSFRVVHRNDVVPHFLPPCLTFDTDVDCIGLNTTRYPYHHGTEVWYDNDMVSENSTHRVCLGNPDNEDATCSNSRLPIIKHAFRDHVNYYGVHVSTYGKAGCQDPQQPTASQLVGYRWDTRLFGHYDESVTYSAEECKSKCNADQRCRAMTLNNNLILQNGWSNCYLYIFYDISSSKSMSNEPGWITYFKNESSISMPVSPNRGTVGNINYNIRLHGHYDESYTSSANMCKNKCIDDQKCRAMSYPPEDTGWWMCYLFDTYNKSNSKSMTSEYGWATWFKSEVLELKKSTQSSPLTTMIPELDDYDFVSIIEDVVDEDNGSTARINLYDCGEWTKGPCFNNIALVSSHSRNKNDEFYDPSLTVQRCQKFCAAGNYTIAVLSQGITCRCGFNFSQQPTISEECSLQCIGNASQTCGGISAMSVWTMIFENYDDEDSEDTDDNNAEYNNSLSLSNTETRGCSWTYDGCYVNNPWNLHVLINGSYYIRPTDLTVEFCQTHCLSTYNYRFASLDYGNACHCGVGIKNSVSKELEASCSMPCPGNKLQMCGGPWINSVYKCE